MIFFIFEQKEILEKVTTFANTNWAIFWFIKIQDISYSYRSTIDSKKMLYWRKNINFFTLKTSFEIFYLFLFYHFLDEKSTQIYKKNPIHPRLYEIYLGITTQNNEKVLPKLHFVQVILAPNVCHYFKKMRFCIDIIIQKVCFFHVFLYVCLLFTISRWPHKFVKK